MISSDKYHEAFRLHFFQQFLILLDEFDLHNLTTDECSKLDNAVDKSKHH